MNLLDWIAQLLNANASPKVAGAWIAVASIGALAAAIVGGVGAWYGRLIYRRQEEASEPLIEVDVSPPDQDGDYMITIEASNRSASTMVLEAVEVLRPKTSVLVRSKEFERNPYAAPGVFAAATGAIAPKLALGLRVSRAGSTQMVTKSISFRGGVSAPKERRQTDVGSTAIYLRLPKGCLATQVVLRFTTRIKTNRNRLVRTKVWQDLP